MINPIEQIVDAIKKGKALFFVGSGVSAEAGLPTWPKAMELLADHIYKADRSIAVAMKDRIRSLKLLEAAELYYLSDTDEDYRIKGLELVFGEEPQITDNLRCFIGISPSAFITTNYDLALEHTWSDVFHRSILTLRNNKRNFLLHTES